MANGETVPHCIVAAGRGQQCLSTRSGTSYAGHDLDGHHAVVDVSATQHHRQRPAQPITGEVNLGRGSASGATDCMISWFGRSAGEPVRSPCVNGREPAGAGSVLVSAHDAGVDRDLTIQFLDRLGNDPSLVHQRGEGAVTGPPSEPVSGGRPRAMAFGQVPPGDPGLASAGHAVDHSPVVHPRSARGSEGRLQALDGLPLRVGQSNQL